MSDAKITLIYDGQDASDHELDFYDAAVALMGFQRSLAIVTHLVINGEVITQAPSLKGAQVRAEVPRAGSWELPAVIAVAAGAAYKLGTAPKDSTIGHLVRSAYDYVVSSTMGFHVDFDKTLGEQYEEVKKAGVNIKHLHPSQLDSATEKCEIAVRDMHRPIVFSESASIGFLISGQGAGAEPISAPFTAESYTRMVEGLPATRRKTFVGRVSSYNINTFKGRIFLNDAARPVPFEIESDSRSPETVRIVTRSLALNASRRGGRGEITVVGRPSVTRTGRLKSILIDLATEGD